MEMQNRAGVTGEDEEAMAVAEPAKAVDPVAPEALEDAAVLYAWANLQGAKYRDFSATRREYRAPTRHREEELPHEKDLRAAAEAETTAAAAEAEAAKRLEAARRADAAAYAESVAQHEAREIAETTPYRTAMGPTARPESAGPAWLFPSALDADRPGRSAAYKPPQQRAVQPMSQWLSQTVTRQGMTVDRTDQPGPGSLAAQQMPAPQMVETLQHSRERVAARWYALKSIFETPRAEDLQGRPMNQANEMAAPTLAVFSLAGGVGKTSLVATLGRTLSSMGEKILLTDTTGHGLLPFYFGASELLPGVVRSFSPPANRSDAPIALVSYDVDPYANNVDRQEEFAREFAVPSRGIDRVLLDLTSSSTWMVRCLVRLKPTVLVPLAPDMNSVISLRTIQRFFHGLRESEGLEIKPFFVLNQFDAALPLHLDVREVLGQQLGPQLLPFVIRRSPAVSEALAEGMTVVDYAPGSPIARDYRNVAMWLRDLTVPMAALRMQAAARSERWIERSFRADRGS